MMLFHAEPEDFSRFGDQHLQLAESFLGSVKPDTADLEGMLESLDGKEASTKEC